MNSEGILGIGAMFAIEPVAWAIGVTAWALGGGALLLAGARWIARLPDTTFWQSVKAWVAASVCGAIVVILGGLGAYQFGQIAWLVAVVAIVALVVVFFGIIKAVLGVTLGKAVLASVPLIGANGLVLAISVFISGIFSAQGNAVAADLGAIEHGIETFQLDMGRYPTNDEGLVVVRSYLTKATTDPWGRPYQYACPGEHNQDGFDLWSLGPSGEGKGEGGLNNWSGR